MIKTPNFFIVKVIGVLIGELIENKCDEERYDRKEKSCSEGTIPNLSQLFKLTDD